MSNVSNPNKPNQGQGQGGQYGSGSQPHQQGGQAHQGGQSTQSVSSGVAATMEKAKEAVSGTVAGMGEKVSDAANYVGEKAMAAGTTALHSAEDAASYMGKCAEGGLAAVGSGLKSFGETVRHQAPGGELLRNGMGAVADTLESTGKYLEEEGFSGIAEDVTSLIKRNPIPALFVGIGVGFLLAKATSSSRS